MSTGAFERDALPLGGRGAPPAPARSDAGPAAERSASRLDTEVRIEPDYDFLSPEYRSFYRPGRGTAFQAPLWLDRIHRKLAPGLGAEQRTVTVRRRDSGELIALLPLVLQKSSGLKILQPADFGVCDYNAVVGNPGTLEMIACDADILAQIDAATRGCDLVIMRKVRDDGFDIGRLFPKAASSVCENAAYHSETGDDFEAWRSRTVRKKFSKELNRLQRQVDREFGAYEHRPAADEAEIRRAFAFLQSARAGRFEDDLFANPLYCDFYLDYALAAAETGEAITYVSTVAGEPVAVLFGLTGDGQFHAVLIGSDQDRLARHSAGTQILYQVIKLRFDEGFRLFDMGLGNTGYKSHFRVDETGLRNFTRSRSVAGAAMALIYHRAKPLKNLLRKYVRNVR